MTTNHLRRIVKVGTLGFAAATAAVITAVSFTFAGVEASPPVAQPVAAALPAPAAGSGWARVGHFAPSAAPVDVWVDGAPFATGIAFKNVSDYAPLTAGVHRFELRAAGQPDSPTLIDVQAGVPDGGSVTIGAVTTRDGIASQVYDDALTAPPAGEALVRFIHAAPDVQAVDVQVIDGPLLAASVPYPAATGYEAIPAGQYDVQVLAAGTPNVLLQVRGWSIDPGAQSSIVIVKGLDGQLDVAPLRDSAAVPVPPVGGVQTGFGGMARAAVGDSDNSMSAIGSTVAGLATVAMLFVVVRRRQLRTVTVGR